MSYYGADTDSVQQVGKSVFDREPAATAAVMALLNAYDDAAATVHHAKMRAALTAFREAHQKGHLQLPREIQRLGKNTASGGTTLADGQNESSSIQAPSCTDGENLVRHLDRPIQP